MRSSVSACQREKRPRVGYRAPAAAGGRNGLEAEVRLLGVAQRDSRRDKCNLADLVLTNTRLTLANDVEVQVSHFPYAESNPKPSTTGAGD